jgi:hypothetical protein
VLLSLAEARTAIFGSVKIFISYPREERAVAEHLNFALLANHHDVFFDFDDLTPGLEYDQAIARAIESSDLFIFLITPGAVTAGRYTLTELRLAEERWPHPNGRVLPVMLVSTDMSTVPAYLRAVDIFMPSGDPAVETAHQAERLLRSRRLTTRVLRWARSRTGMVTLGSIVVIGAVAGIARPWEQSAGGRTVRLPAEVRRRARAAASMDDSGFVIATANPAQLVRYSARGVPIGEPVELMGEPVSVRRTPTQILVATRARDGIMVFDAKKLRMVDSIALDPGLVRQPHGFANPPRRSGDIQSVALRGGDPWVTTGDRDGEPTMLRFRTGERRWEVATFVVDTAGFGSDALGVRLRDINGELWGASVRASASFVYHVVGFVRIDRFNGRNLKLVSCAHDVAESPSGNALFLSCDNELQEVYAEGNQITLVRTRPTLPSERATGNFTYDILESDSSRVIVALNTVSGANDRPTHARIAEVDSAGQVNTLLDIKDAVVRSMGVTPGSVVAVLRRADGSSDVTVVSRRR